MTAIDAFASLGNYCQGQSFKGWDPYDGLNSKVFKTIPFANRSALLRLIVIQSFKRSPINIRKIAGVPKEYNAKGIALCLSAYANLCQILNDRPELEERLGTYSDALVKCDELAQLLISLQSQGDYHGACWGYNFDWQARRLFLFPKYTPTVVATTFAASALVNASEITQNKHYLDVALSSAEFVLRDLHRTPVHDGFLFSYSPLKGNDTVINASMLGSKLLAKCYHYTGNLEYREAAQASLRACCAMQRNDGAWPYGMLPLQSWVDSFHTGYNLEALYTYAQDTGDGQFNEILERGFEYYIKHFFEPDGCPKYYDIRRYPIDIHCPAQLFITLSILGKFNEHFSLAKRVLDWTIGNMRDAKYGYYYYQLKPHFSSKISYMRWSNAYMLYALSHYILNL